MGSSPWSEHPVGEGPRRAAAAASMARRLVNRARVRPPAARMSAASSSMHGRLGLGPPAVGEVAGHVEQRVVREVERAADVELARDRTRRAQAPLAGGRHGGARQHGGRRRPTALGELGPHVDRGEAAAPGPGGPLHPDHVGLGRVDEPATRRRRGGRSRCRARDEGAPSSGDPAARRPAPQASEQPRRGAPAGDDPAEMSSIRRDRPLGCGAERTRVPTWAEPAPSSRSATSTTPSAIPASVGGSEGPRRRPRGPGSGRG